MSLVKLDPLAQQRFLELIREGVGPVSAGVELMMTPREVDHLLADPEFSEALEAIETQKDEEIEKVIYDKAKLGNRWAVEMWAFNRMKDKWQPPSQKIEVRRTETNPVVVVSVREMVAELHQQYGPAALQQGGILDVDSRDSEG